MSKKASEHHKKASEHLTRAARHHGEAAKRHEAGSHEKAAHHAHLARGHVIHGRGHAEEAVKAHLEEHGKNKFLETICCSIFRRRNRPGARDKAGIIFLLQSDFIMPAAVPRVGLTSGQPPRAGRLCLSDRQETSQPNARTSTGWNRIVLMIRFS
jgi:hypothetical protein